MKIDNKLILENSKNLHILYVEDDETLRNLTSRVFANFFTNIDTAKDGKDGLKKYREYRITNGYPYDLVITDVNMPNMSGIEMCEAIKSDCFEQVIIFITAFNDTQYLHDAIELGANGFLIKPINPEKLKETLYKTTQMLADKKVVQKYYQGIENITGVESGKIDATFLNAPKDILDDLTQNKVLISTMWVTSKTVEQYLKIHTIDREYFRKHFGIKVIEYFLDVVEDESKIGNCPIIFVMLDFFKNKRLPLKDVFIICIFFKNSLITYIFDKYSFNKKLFERISYILDKNFEGVITEYLEREKVAKENNSIDSINGATTIIETSEKQSLDDITYSEYVLESDLYDLQDLEEDIDSLAIFVTESNRATFEDIIQLGETIKRYGEILTNYPLFTELGKYIIKLGINFKDNSELLMNDKERMSNISVLLEGFINDLLVWRKEIFENNIKDPHFLDNSFISNVNTIIMFIEYDETNESNEVVEDDGFEFF